MGKIHYLLTGKKAYRGLHVSEEEGTKILGSSVESEGVVRGVQWQGRPGQSWTYDLDQAEYHALGRPGKPVSLVFTAPANNINGLDFRELYKLSSFRGIASEAEILAFDPTVKCDQVKWW